MARQDGTGPAQVYNAAGQWVDRCLRRDDSLFTPGHAIWSAAVVQDLHERFVERPDESNRDFMMKFRDQLAGAPPETVQLAAEILYVHFLIAASVSGNRKREVIEQVLACSPAPVSILSDLAGALDHGLAGCGTGFNTHRPFLLMILVGFARLWKGLPPAARDAALTDPWEFKRLLFSVQGTAALLQQHALLHLAFPDTFEDTVSDDRKSKIANANAYAKYVTDGRADVDRRLLEIRRGIEAETGQRFGFYDPDQKPRWSGPEAEGARYWKIAPGDNAWQWDECRAQGFIALGWDELGDVSRLDRSEFETLRNQMIAEHGWGPQGPDQVWDFSQIQPGDRVVANRGTTVALGFGTVTGPYYFVPDVRHGHRLPVDWDDTQPRTITQGGWRRALIELKRRDFERLLASAPTEVTPDPPLPPVPLPPTRPTPDIFPPYSIEECANDTHLPVEQIRHWLAALDRKGQAVLYGPPGTGKTFVAQHLARHLVGGTDGTTQLVQFHPSYAYEDFVLGIRPRTGDGGRLEYPTVPGRFLDFCANAATRTGPCVLVLDEINRANLSRVFGELMYLLEYRDQAVALAGGRQFSIPSNVRLIGTMNTADRSIALVDYALRRRFAFLALYPDYEVLRRFHKDGDVALVEALVAVIEDLNKAIGDRHYQIGVSFFLHRELAAHLEDIWRMEIEPYVEEFFFDQPERIAAVRWDHIRQRLGQ